MNAKIATMLTVGGFVTGATVGGIVPIVLLSGGLGVTVAEIINILKD